MGDDLPGEILFCARLGQEGHREAGKVGPEEEVEGVEAQGATGGML